MQAFIQTADRVDDERFRITAGGRFLKHQNFFVEGAYWIGKKINHFEDVFADGSCYVEIPSIADRLAALSALFDDVGRSIAISATEIVFIKNNPPHSGTMLSKIKHE